MPDLVVFVCVNVSNISTMAQLLMDACENSNGVLMGSKVSSGQSRPLEVSDYLYTVYPFK